jgi:hypothetical protein
MQTPEDADRTPAVRARSAAVNRGAGLRITGISKSSEVMREIENIALTELDVLAVRRMTDLDRRFHRARSKLGSELARRQESVPETHRRRHPVTLDMWAFLIASVGMGLLLAVDRRGEAVATDAALIGAAGLGAVSVALHVLSGIRATRSGASATQSRPLVMLTTGVLFVAVLGGLLRFSKDSEASFLIAATALGVLISAVVFTAVLFARGSQERKAEVREDAAREQREDTMRSDLQVQLGELISTSRAEAESIFGALDDGKRAALDSAVAAGIAAVEKRGILETAAIRKLRNSRRGELRYDVNL